MHLTRSAMAELEMHRSGLDPTYDYNQDAADCSVVDVVPDFHVPGADHCPFTCSPMVSDCCASELSSMRWIYAAALANLRGEVLEPEGEPWVVIDEERPCED